MVIFAVTRQRVHFTCRWESNVVDAKQITKDQETRKVLLSFAQSIQERDIVTYEHSRRVATYASRLARYLGWSRREARDLALADRKSTRLNSSHRCISYAVFCLKKKK